MSVYGLPSPGGIVVGVDDGSSAHGAVIWAARAAAARRLPLVVCHAYCPRDTRAGHELECAARNRALRTAQYGVEVAMAEAPTVRVEAWVAEGQPARVLLDAVVAPELIVVGFRARGRLAAELLETFTGRADVLTPCPVVAVPALAARRRRPSGGPVPNSRRGQTGRSGPDGRAGRADHPRPRSGLVVATTAADGSADDGVVRFASGAATWSGSRVVETPELDGLALGSADHPGGPSVDLVVVGRAIGSAPEFLRTPGSGRGEPLKAPPATTLSAALGYGSSRRMGTPVAVVPVSPTSAARVASAPVATAQAGHVAALPR
jgi:Universal stress protein family